MPKNPWLRRALYIAVVILGLATVLVLPYDRLDWKVLAQPYDEPAEGFDVHGNCDYGRHPQVIWLDNPSGHPFERPFCDGIVGPEVAKDPLDTPENAGKYCDEVPECWAYNG